MRAAQGAARFGLHPGWCHRLPWGTLSFVATITLRVHRGPDNREEVSSARVRKYYQAERGRTVTHWWQIGYIPFTRAGANRSESTSGRRCAAGEGGGLASGGVF